MRRIKEMKQEPNENQSTRNPRQSRLGKYNEKYEYKKGKKKIKQKLEETFNHQLT